MQQRRLRSLPRCPCCPFPNAPASPGAGDPYAALRSRTHGWRSSAVLACARRHGQAPLRMHQLCGRLCFIDKRIVTDPTLLVLLQDTGSTQEHAAHPVASTPRTHHNQPAQHCRALAPASRRRARLARPPQRPPCASHRAPRPPRRRLARLAPTRSLQRRQRRAPRPGPLRSPAPCLTAQPRCRLPPLRRPPAAGRPGTSTSVLCSTRADCDLVVHLGGRCLPVLCCSIVAY